MLPGNQLCHNYFGGNPREGRGSTIGEDGDTTISSPGRSPKQPLAGIELHDPLHGWQACPEFITFDQGLVKYVPGRDYFRAVSYQNGDKFVTPPPPPPQSLNWSRNKGTLIKCRGALACAWNRLKCFVRS